MFTIVPDHLWIFADAIGGTRREALLSTSYDDIVASIVSKANVDTPKKERNRTPVLGYCPGSLERYRVEAKVSPEVVDLFHNGAGGYRAQFYQSPELGDLANKYCRGEILGLVKSQEMAKNQSWMIQSTAASLYCETTKVWIGQGLWFRQENICLRNLLVSRWSCDPTTADKVRKQRWRRSTLAPDKENRIDLIGGWLRAEDQDLLGVNHKPLRSQHIHCFGFT